MSDLLAPLTDALLEAAIRAGAEAADAIATDGTSLSIAVRGGQLEQAETLRRGGDRAAGPDGTAAGLRLGLRHEAGNPARDGRTRPSPWRGWRPKIRPSALPIRRS